MSKQDKNYVNQIANINEDFAQWYTDVVIKTQLVDYGTVKGTMVIRPYGYAIWEEIQAQLNVRFKKLGVKNAYFPMLIPESFMKKEAEHVEGFAPECVTVTRVGKTELAEPLVIRPTSETIINEMYSKWVQSYRDLPLLINQWANVMRWEKTTRPFLRTSEFLWQEGHTLHATPQEADDFAIKILELYQEFCKNVLAMPMLIGRKTEKEKFAGAVATYSIEAMMKDGKSLQAGTTHYLSDNFTKAFEVKYLDRDGTHKNPFSSSWGVSTRLIGALIMTHGDERGLLLPPVVAPVQVVILPIAAHKAGVTEVCTRICEQLCASGIRAECDNRDESAGFKFNDCELKGVPLRLEIGPRDIEANVAVAVRRDNAEKLQVKLDGIDSTVKNLLQSIHNDMYSAAKERMDSRIKKAADMTQLKTVLDDGCFAKVDWCGETDCEVEIKNKLAATTRNMPFDQSDIGKKCVCCGKKAKKVVFIARAY